MVECALVRTRIAQNASEFKMHGMQGNAQASNCLKVRMHIDAHRMHVGPDSVSRVECAVNVESCAQDAL